MEVRKVDIKLEIKESPFRQVFLNGKELLVENYTVTKNDSTYQTMLTITIVAEPFSIENPDDVIE